MTLLLRLAGLGAGGFLTVAGLASLILGFAALGEHPERGIQVLLLSLLIAAAGGWMLWETYRSWRNGRPPKP